MDDCPGKTRINVAQKRTQTAKAKKSDRSFVALIALLLIAGAGVIGYVAFKPKPAPVTIDPNTPLPDAQGYVIGSDTAPVEIIEFGDFECPGCGQFAVITEPDVRTRLVNTGAARFRFLDFPIASHLASLTAHNAAACANAQGRFWEMHDRIFAGQHEWSHFANNRDMNAPRVFNRYARELGLNADAFETCLENREHELQIRANAREGERLGIQFTPTFIIGDQRVTGAQPYDVIKKLVEDATAAARSAPPPAKLGDTAVRR
jgi:protein-disulfide isomerase